MTQKGSRARVLVYDIEASPNLAYVWGKWQQDVVKFEEEWHMLSFAYKWLGEKQTYVLSLPDFAGYDEDPSNDYELVQALWQLFDEADIVIAHNGDNFDQRKSNARFLHWGLTPPAPYRSIDTYKVAKKYFNLNSWKLGDLGELLGFGGKEATGGFATWLGCMRGDRKAWATMRKYNKQDVILLEKIYLELRPWMNNHPAMNLLDDRPDSCPKCGEGPLESRGLRITKTLTYRRFQCQACGGWSSERQAQKAEQRVSYVN